MSPASSVRVSSASPISHLARSGSRTRASRTKSLAVTTRRSASPSGAGAASNSARTPASPQACQLALTECLEVGGHGRVTVLEMPLADAAQAPTILAMKIRLALMPASLALLALAACGKQEQLREVEWAKAALARNPAMEIIATDETAGVFTVRDTSRWQVLQAATGRTHRRAAATAEGGCQACAPAAPPAVESPAAVEATVPASEPAAAQTTETVLAPRAGSRRTAGRGSGLQHFARRRAISAPPPALEGPGYSITRDEPVRTARAERRGGSRGD